jgi:hypothetical protein
MTDHGATDSSREEIVIAPVAPVLNQCFEAICETICEGTPTKGDSKLAPIMPSRGFRRPAVGAGLTPIVSRDPKVHDLEILRLLGAPLASRRPSRLPPDVRYNDDATMRPYPC